MTSKIKNDYDRMIADAKRANRSSKLPIVEMNICIDLLNRLDNLMQGFLFNDDPLMEPSIVLDTIERSIPPGSSEEFTAAISSEFIVKVAQVRALRFLCDELARYVELQAVDK